MTLTACTNCGTQTNPGMACPRCGTPTPTTTSISPETGYAAYWQSILERLRRVAAPKYEVNGVLGYGGMAGVFLAREPRLGRNVAIKVMSPALMIDPSLVERFEQEARTIALLNHPNIVTILEVDQREDLHWFAMAHVPGRTLTEVLNEATEPLPISVVAAWFYQMADALAYAHQQGVVHRDVKPGNVLLDLRGNAQVTDFGIAKVAGGESSQQQGSAPLTRTGMLVGTPTYMSPEQCTSGRITGASDQYSLGAVVYQMLAGAPPFVGPTLSVIAAHVSGQPTFLGDLRPDCPDGLVNAVHRMLEKSPQDRWPTMSAAIAAAGATVPGFDNDDRKEMEDLATPAARVTVSPREYSLREGQRRGLQVSLMSAAGRELSGRAVSLRSADNAVADTSGGELRALSPGSTEVTVSSGPASLGISITVEADPIGNVSLEPTEIKVGVGTTQQLKAVVLDIDGTPLEDRALLWRSNNPGVARVSSDGVVEGVEPGNALVAARTGGKYATANVVVVEAPMSVGAPQSSVTRPTPTSAASIARTSERKTTGTRATSARREAKPIVTVETPATAAPAKGRTAVIAGGVAVAAVVAVLLVLQPWRGSGGAGSTAGDATPPAVSNTNGSIALGVAVPAGGRATARDASGTTVDLSAQATNLAAGSYTLSMSAPGFEQADTVVALRDGDAISWSPVLKAVAANTTTKVPASVPVGNIAIASTLPADGNVFARDSANVPYPISTRATPLPAGTYRLEFRATGFTPRDSTVVLRSGQSIVWNPEIRAVVAAAPAPREGTLVVRGTVPQGGQLVARDSTDRSWPLVGERTSLPPGRYTLEFRAVGYETESRQITLQPGQSETWSPVMRAAAAKAPATPPVADVRADQAAIEALVREFQADFNRRDTSVVKLLPQSARSTWSGLLTNRSVTDFSVALSAIEPARVTGDNATIQFTLDVAFRSGNANNRQPLRYIGTARRAGAAWQLVSMAVQR